MARQRERHSDQERSRGPQARNARLLAPTLAAVSPEEAASLLQQGEVRGGQIVPAGTNYTFIVLMSVADRGEFLAIYKPQRGERPLWDFPPGTLYRREHAAYLASLELGWPRIPATVIRHGPLGIGTMQMYVETEKQWQLADLFRGHQREMMEIALFDLLVNNADRKAGHCLLGADGRIWAIDHGLTFNVEPKLRTVLWEFSGSPIPDELLQQLASLKESLPRRQQLRARLEPDLHPAEIDAFFRRLEALLSAGRFPQLDPRRNVPWPLV